MSRHEFKTDDAHIAMVFGQAKLTMTITQNKHTGFGEDVSITTTLTPAKAEDLREMLQLYQNQLRRGGKQGG